MANDIEWGLGGGGGVKIPTPVTESGYETTLEGQAFVCANIRDCFGLNLQLHFDHSNGNEFFQPSDKTNLLFGISKQKRAGATSDVTNLYLGVDSTDYGYTFTLGRDLFHRSLTWKTGEHSGFSLEPYVRQTIQLANETAEENLPLIALSVGVSGQFHSFDDTTSLPDPAPTMWDNLFFMANQLHGFSSDVITASALTDPSKTLQDYSNQLFGSSGSPSTALEGFSFFLSLTQLGGVFSDGEDQSLILGKEKDTGLLTLAIAARTLGSFLYGMEDKGVSGLNTLGVLGIAHAMSIHPGSTKEDGAAFLKYRFLLHGATFLAGLLDSTGNTGQALLLGGGQALLTATLSPDPANNTHLISKTSYLAQYEINSDGSRYFGGKILHHSPSANMYTSTAFLVQTTPIVNSDTVQNGIDVVTGRDARTEGAKAKLIASAGYEVSKDQLTGNLGLRAGLLRGEGSFVLPSVGVEANGLFNFSSNLVGAVGLFADYTGGNLGGGVSVGLGLSF
ncbi:MAG: hypothetical protein HY877_08510 [Deltaproteobacteria bacterium]|nr:hypothetical protein [Deltaproteobacteria bacterium]